LLRVVYAERPEVPELRSLVESYFRARPQYEFPCDPPEKPREPWAIEVLRYKVRYLLSHGYGGAAKTLTVSGLKWLLWLRAHPIRCIACLVVTLVIIALCLVAIPKARQDPVVQKPHVPAGGKQPAAVIGAESAMTRDKLRNERHLRPLPDVDNDRPLSELPAGVYGFIPPWTADDQDVTVSKDSKGTATLEIHKLGDGAVHLVGFVSEAGAGTLKSDKSGTIMLFPLPWEEATTLAAVPMSRVESLKDRSFREAHVIDIKLLPR
jgi:hypothetical protein